MDPFIDEYTSTILRSGHEDWRSMTISGKGFVKWARMSPDSEAKVS